ncbi:MAG: RlmE family RNA methyltransferase [Planctomycetota bacterium]
MGRRVLHDEFFQRAKRDGYVARSAYKLLEIQERSKLIKPGDRVLDLGCAPGSWLQVADRIVGERGTLVGVDLQATRVHGLRNARTIVGDVTTLELKELLDDGERFDVLLSDMAPSTSGHGDDLVSARLCREVLAIATQTLREGGKLAMKILEGAEYPAVVAETKSMFRTARGLKPRATRTVSREMFIIGDGFRP